MKKIIVSIILTAILNSAVPYIVYSAKNETEVLNREEEKTAQSTVYSSDSEIEVFNHTENATQTMNFRDYIIGVVAAEMPAEFHDEALSAAAVAAATLARKNLAQGADPNLMGAVISTDSTKHQAYMSKEEMQSRWGDDFQEYYDKICTCVDKAVDYTITYDGKPIVAAYHAISPGMTENAENIWITGFPYLVSVESPGDKLSPKYEQTVTFTHDEFRKTMEEDGTVLSENSAEWFGSAEYSEAGTLMNIKIGDKNYSGKQLRELLSLRSYALTFENTSDGISVTSKGYGHGVGMSQYGADYYARQGYTWQEIIAHYYPGTELEKIE